MTQLNLHRKLHTTPVSLISHLPTEDAKKMAVKEEKYDPGYEAAYGSAYSGNPCDSEPCSLPSNGLSMFPSRFVPSRGPGGDGNVLETESNCW